MFRFVIDSNVYAKTVMHRFQLSKIEELKSSTVTIRPCYPFSIHSVLFTFLKLRKICENTSFH